MMKIEQEYIAITLDTGPVAIMGFVTQGRGSDLPSGAVWIDQAGGWWSRAATDANIFDEISRATWGERTPVRYRRVSLVDIPVDRTYRNALLDDGQKLDFDMPTARELHRNRLRVLRVAEFEKNDLDLRDAQLANNQTALDAAIARMNALRNITDDPSIEAAQNIEDLKLAGMAILNG